MPKVGKNAIIGGEIAWEGKKNMNRKRLALTASAATLFAALVNRGGVERLHIYKKPREGQIRVACVGDSITYGVQVKNWIRSAYPSVLGKLLGSDYCVENFGYSGRTALSDGDKPYIKYRLYKKSIAFKPDIVIIMLGTNDTKEWNWKGRDRYIRDYSRLIDTYLSLDSKPEVFIVVPPPAFEIGGRVNFNINGEIIEKDLCPAAREIADALNLGLIDLHAAMRGRPELFADGVHPNAEGAEVFAKLVYESIKG